MTKLKFLQPKARSNYLLEVIDTPVSQSAKKARVKGGFSSVKKIASILTIGTLAVLGLGAGLGAATAADTSATSANAALFDPTTWFCATKDSPGAYLGGRSNTLNSGWNGEDKGSPIGNGINITVSDDLVDGDTGAATTKWTALEQYGYYSPSYETWQGVAYENEFDGQWPFIGSGGHGSTEQFGNIVAITEAEKSPFLSHNMMDCLNVGSAMNPGIGNFLSFLPKMGVAIAGETYGIASSMDITNPDSPLNGLATGVSDMITGGDDPSQGLRQLLFLDWIIAIIFIATGSLIWVGLVKRSSMQAAQGALWMIGATIGGALFLINPLMVPGWIDKVVGDVNASVTAALLPASETGNQLCTVDAGATAGQATSVRQVKCSIWYSVIYTPWVNGQFGVDEYSMTRVGNSGDLTGTAKAEVEGSAWMLSDSYDNGRGGESNVGIWDQSLKGDGITSVEDNANPPTEASAVVDQSRGIFANADIQLGNAAYEGPMNWAIYMLDRQNNWTENRGVDYSEIAFNQIVVNNNTHWASASDAIGSSMMSILASIGPVAIMMALSVTMIGYQVSMIFLIAFSPLLFLAGVAPGWGRRIAMRWFELIVGLLIKRIVLAIFLVLFVKLYGVVLNTDLDWWIQVLIVSVLSFVALAQKDKITDIFNSAIDFGGDKRIDGGGQIAQQMKQKAQSGISRAGRGAGYAALRAAPVAGKVGAATLSGAKRGAGASVKAVNDKMRNLDAKAQVGTATARKNTRHWEKTTASTLNKGRLSPAELEHMKDDKGNFSRERASKFIETKKASFISRDQENKVAQQKAIEKQKQAKSMMKHRDTRKEGKDLMRSAKDDRVAVRDKAKELQKETVRIFGTDKKGVKGALKSAVKPSSNNKPSYYKKSDTLFDASHSSGSKPSYRKAGGSGGGSHAKPKDNQKKSSGQKRH